MARVLDNLTTSGDEEHLQPDIDAGLASGGWQGLNRYFIAGDDRIPSVRFFADGDGLGHSTNRARPPYCYTPDLRENKQAVVQPRSAMLAHLRIGEGVVAVAALKARKARCATFSDAPKECLIGALHAQHDILQHLAMDLGILGQRLLDAGQLGLLLKVADVDSTHPPRFAALAKGGVID
jgi:hypothetical protein